MPKAVAILAVGTMLYICAMRYLDQTQIQTIGKCASDNAGQEYIMVYDAQAGRIGCLAIPSMKAL